MADLHCWFGQIADTADSVGGGAVAGHPRRGCTKRCTNRRCERGRMVAVTLGAGKRMRCRQKKIPGAPSGAPGMVWVGRKSGRGG